MVKRIFIDEFNSANDTENSDTLRHPEKEDFNIKTAKPIKLDKELYINDEFANTNDDDEGSNDNNDDDSSEDADFEYEHTVDFIWPVAQEIIYNINNFYVDEDGDTVNYKLQKVKIKTDKEPLYGYKFKFNYPVSDEVGGIFIESFAATLKKNIKEVNAEKERVLILYLEDKK
jgi:hypothetical protein